MDKGRDTPMFNRKKRKTTMKLNNTMKPAGPHMTSSGKPKLNSCYPAPYVLKLLGYQEPVVLSTLIELRADVHAEARSGIRHSCLLSGLESSGLGCFFPLQAHHKPQTKSLIQPYYTLLTPPVSLKMTMFLSFWKSSTLKEELSRFSL